MRVPRVASTAIDRVDEAVSRSIRRHRGTRLGTALLLGPAVLTIGLLLVAPALLLVRYSFYGFAEGEIVREVTLANYARILDVTLYQAVTVRSVRIATVVTVLTFLIGFPLAYAAVRRGGWLGRVIVLSTFAPLTIDIVIRSFGWFVLLSDGGLLQSLVGAVPIFPASSPPSLIFNELAIVIGMVHIILPFVVFPIINVLHTIPVELEEASRDLGANRFETVGFVVLPLALPGIVSGLLMGFLLTMASYVTPSILGGKITVLPTMIVDQIIGSNNWPFAGALSMILLAIAVLVIVGYHRTRRHLREPSRD